MRLSVLRGLTASALVIAFISPTAAQEVFRMRLSHWTPAGHPMAVYLAEWAKELEAASNGQLVIEVFPGGQLGPVADHYDMVRRGVVDIGWILHGATSDRFPLTGLIDIPFTVDSAVHGTRVLNDPELRERFLDAEHRGLKVLYLFTTPPAQIHTVDKPVTAPGDLVDLRIRYPSATAKAYLDYMGADSVGLPPSSIAEAVQKKVIDGVLIDYGGAGVAYKLGGLIGHVAQVNAYVTSFGIVMNPRAWDRLPKRLQSLITASLDGIEEKVGAIWDGLDEPGKQALIAGGAQIHVPDDAAMAQFRAAGAAVAEDIVSQRESEGADARAAYELILELAKKYRQ
jgi:TRAP-type C4-dicarboxylate transport system substrate-binding protein